MAQLVEPLRAQPAAMAMSCSDARVGIKKCERATAGYRKLLFSFMLTLKQMQGKQLLNASELRFLLAPQTAALDRRYDANPTVIDPAAPAFVASADDDEEEDDDDDEDDAANAAASAASAAANSLPAAAAGSAQGSVAAAAAAAAVSASAERWLPDVQWQQLVHLAELPAFAGLDQHLKQHQRRWRNFYEANDPSARALPGSWAARLSQFQKLLVLRCFRPDRVTQSIQRVVAHTLGREFITPPPFDLHTAYGDSDPCSPLIFILSPGVDPVKDVYKLAYELGFSTPDRLFSISLGQGQGPLAESAIREAIDKGTWVLLQNCVRTTFLRTRSESMRSNI